ncbi:MAG: acetylxylan esterase [Planctomycetia bacterium]|nr:acetylxylan esterase [Planctomycetia bacterium]
MKAHRFFVLFLLILTITATLWAEVKTLTIDVDRADQLYRCGEPATFTVTAKEEDGVLSREGKLTVQFQNDFRKEISRHEIDLAKANPATLKETLTVPGFLSVRAVCGPISELAGCGYEVEKIQPAVPCPEDFNAYWADLKKQVRALPEDFKLEEIPELCSDKCTVYRLSIRTLGENKFAHGFLSVPKNQGDGPFPLWVMVPGAGPGCGPDLWQAKNGIMTLHMNVFPYPVSLNADERKKQYDDFHVGLKSGLRYCQDGATSRDTYFYRDAYVGIDRAIDVVAARPDVDKKRIVLIGVSQGGASALILGGLSDRWLAIVSSVPALCDHGGAKLDRSPGWPKLYDAVKDPAAEAVGPYFDGENFARNIHCPIRVTVGFIDTTCSPSSVYAAYNVIPSTDKQMGNEVKRGHATGQKHSDASQWLRKMIGK